MIKIQSCWLGLLMGVFALFLHPAQADDLTVLASGTVSVVDDPEGLLPFDMLLPRTTQVELRFRYESEQGSSLPPFAPIGIYSDVASIELVIEGVRVALPDGEITIANDRPDRETGEVMDVWQMSAIPADPDLLLNPQIGFTLLTIRDVAPVPPLDGVELIEPEWPGGWDRGVIAYRLNRSVCPGDLCESITLASVLARLTAVSVIPTSENLHGELADRLFPDDLPPWSGPFLAQYEGMGLVIEKMEQRGLFILMLWLPQRGGRCVTFWPSNVFDCEQGDLPSQVGRAALDALDAVEGLGN